MGEQGRQDRERRRPREGGGNLRQNLPEVGLQPNPAEELRNMNYIYMY